MAANANTMLPATMPTRGHSSSHRILYSNSIAVNENALPQRRIGRI
jgi:hypothetical protein